MKFLLYLSVAVTLIVSCASDDDAKTPEDENTEDPQDVLYYLDKVTYQDEDFEVELYADNKVKKIELIDFNYEFIYEEDLVSRVLYITHEGVSVATNFEYDENDRISSFSYDDKVYDVDYDPETRTYSYINHYDIIEPKYSFSLNSKGDMKKYTMYDPITQESTSWGYEFDETKKGALWNSNSISVYVYMIQHNSLDLMLPFNKYPVSTVSNGLGDFECENEFNEGGYVTKTVAAGREVIFNYTEQ